MRRGSDRAVLVGTWHLSRPNQNTVHGFSILYIIRLLEVRDVFLIPFCLLVLHYFNFFILKYMNESQNKQLIPISSALVSIILLTLMVSFALFQCLLKALVMVLYCMAF